METKEKSGSPIAWVLGQTGDHKRQYVFSVILAIISQPRCNICCVGRNQETVHRETDKDAPGSSA